MSMTPPVQTIPTGFTHGTGTDGKICVSESKTFTTSVNMYGGELGYYVIEECGMDILNPTIAMEVGGTYTFIQKDRTNYYHRTFFFPHT